MGFFSFMHRRFVSLETTEHDAELNVEDAVKHWNAYVKTIPEKQTILGTTLFDLQKHLPVLKNLLQTELDDLQGDVRDEDELIEEVDRINYDFERKRIKILKDRLDAIESESRYLFMLLEELYELLHSELNLVRRFLAGAKHPQKIVAHLKEHLRTEMQYVRQIQAVIDRDKVENEQYLFHALVRGNRVVRKLNEKESDMREKLFDLAYNEALTESITKHWIEGVFAALDDAISLEVHNKTMAGKYVDLRFINSDKLLSELAIRVLRQIRGNRFPKNCDMHHPLIKAFVDAFRTVFNDDHLLEER